MKFFDVAEIKAKFSECVELSKSEPVVVLSHGKPVAVLTGMTDLDLEDIALAGDEKFWKMIEARRREKAIPLDQLDEEIARLEEVEQLAKKKPTR